MAIVRAKAPTLAWLLTALTCLLTGMALTEARHQPAALPAVALVAVVETVETAEAPAPTSAPPPSPSPLFDVVPVPPSTGTATLRVARLTVPPGVGPPPEVASGPTVLMVETGALSVRYDGAVWVGQGLDATQTETVLGYGERLVLAPGARYIVRNDGPTPAVALVVTILPVETATPMLGPAEPPPGGTA